MLYLNAFGIQTGILREHLERVQGKQRYGVPTEETAVVEGAGQMFSVTDAIVSLLRLAGDKRLFLVLGCTAIVSSARPHFSISYRSFLV